MKKVTAKVLFLGAFLESGGASFMWPINTILIHNYLHQSLAVAGTVLFFNSIFNFLGNYVGGYLFDHIGGHKTVIISTGISLIALIGLIFNHGWPAYPILLPILGFGVGSSYTVINSYASQLNPTNKYNIFTGIYVGSKFGSIIGTALCGTIASINMTLVFVAYFISLGLFFILGIFWYNNGSEFINKTHQKIHLTKFKFQPGITLIVIFIGLLWIVNSQWSSNVSASITAFGIPMSKYSILWTINSILTIILLPLITYLTKNWKWFKRFQIPLGVILFIIAFGSLINATAYVSFATGVILYTLGEMLVSPSIPALISESTPKSKAGHYQSIVSMSSTFPKAIGPLLGGILIDHTSYTVLYLSAIGILILSLFVFKLGRNEIEKMAN